MKNEKTEYDWNFDKTELKAYIDNYLTKDITKTTENISKHELTEAEKAQIKAKLENKFKKEFNLTNSINKEIISGLVIKIEDTLIDLSLRAKLNTFKKQII